MLIVYRIMIVYRFARDRRKFIEQFYGRNTTALWKRFHLARDDVVVVVVVVVIARESTAQKNKAKRLTVLFPDCHMAI